MNRWKPEDGERYYFIDPLGNVNSYLYGDSIDTLYYKVGNCFRTEEEAQHVSVLFKKLLQENILRDKSVCSQLPKLTVEVFDRPDCPGWAKYAAVDEDGSAGWFRRRPSFNIYNNMWYPDLTDCCSRIIEGKYDASNYQDSLIERPAKLPDWCKVGEYVYVSEIKEYFKITDIQGENWMDEHGDHLSYQYCVQARPRPYNTEEMKTLVGRTVSPDYGAVFLVTKFVDTGEGGEVCVDSIYYNADKLLDNFTINGKPCGVLEHLENGEWVE